MLKIDIHINTVKNRYAHKHMLKIDMHINTCKK